MTPTMIFAISVFTYFSAIGFIFSIFWTFNNKSAYKMLSQAAGFDLEEASRTSVESGKISKFLLLDYTSQMTGLNWFALLIIWFPFIHGEHWAWLALWFYPIMFVWHYFHYAKGTKFSKVQLVYAVISAAALILTYTQCEH